jgi:radical SAM superfamily enzyme YgiQ (UPF0313 family)
MRSDPYVLLLYPPIQLMDVETPRPDGSLGPLYLAAALEAQGIPADILDASVGTPEQTVEETFGRVRTQPNGLNRIGMNTDDIAAYVCRKGYTTVGIHSNFTPQTNLVFETARAIKAANPSVQIFAGGVNARAMKDRFLRTGLFDGICLTEGEYIFPAMVRAGMAGESPAAIPGVAFGDGMVNPVNPSCFPAKLDDLPMPAWRKLPLEKYETIASPHGVDVTERKGRRYAPIMTSRGCPFMCSYCHISTEKRENSLTGAVGQLRTHSVERVVCEIDALKALGVQRLFFEDDSLLADKARVEEIFRRVRDRKLMISNVNGVNLIHFFDRSSPRREAWPIDIEYLEILRDAGFDQIVFPVESGSARILMRHATNKVLLDRMNLVELMRTMTRLGIQAPVNMMIGFPDETEAEIQQTIDLAQRLKDAGAPYVTFFIPIPFPGSRLHEIALANGHLEPGFDPDIMNWKRPVMKNTAVPGEKLEEIRDWANEKVNSESHIRLRLEHSVGYRWRSGQERAVPAHSALP